jgi:uncharacterized protein YciI
MTMRVAVITTDKPGALQIRLDTRDAHLAYLKETGVVEMAGPFLDEAGTMCGSLLVLDVADLSAARDWAKNDPYAKAGLFADVRIQEWKKVIG